MNLISLVVCYQVFESINQEPLIEKIKNISWNPINNIECVIFLKRHVKTNNVIFFDTLKEFWIGAKENHYIKIIPSHEKIAFSIKLINSKTGFKKIAEFCEYYFDKCLIFFFDIIDSEKNELIYQKLIKIQDIVFEQKWAASMIPESKFDDYVYDEFLHNLSLKVFSDLPQEHKNDINIVNEAQNEAIKLGDFLVYKYYHTIKYYFHTIPFNKSENDFLLLFDELKKSLKSHTDRESISISKYILDYIKEIEKLEHSNKCYNLIKVKIMVRDYCFTIFYQNSSNKTFVFEIYNIIKQMNEIINKQHWIVTQYIVKNNLIQEHCIETINEMWEKMLNKLQD